MDLRGEDAAPGTQSSYRITVRQLEALVRLSEAGARARCDIEVKPEHVREAKHLLRSSILKVQQSDIAIDEDFEDEEPAQEAAGQASAGHRRITINYGKA